MTNVPPTAGGVHNGPCTLYRFYAADDRLLYVGISENGPGRWKSHRKLKPWWVDVARSTLATYATRQEALEAEAHAIRTEHPAYNVIHNGGHRTPPSCTSGPRQWTFKSRDSRYRWTVPLALYGEANYSSCVDDAYDQSGPDQVRHWLRQVEKHAPDDWARGQVNVTWYINGDCICEGAPIWPKDGSPGDLYRRECNFLRFFTWPRDAETGERLDWYTLPQEHRFPAFAEAVGPLAPFQSTYSIAQALDVAGR